MPVAGEYIQASDVPPSTWTGYTPVLTQPGTVTATVTSARYSRSGALVVVSIYLTVTGTGTASNLVSVSLPVTAVGPAGIVVGSGFIFDASAALIYAGSASLGSTTTVAITLNASTGSPAGVPGSGFIAALASSDQIRIFATYEAA